MSRHFAPGRPDRRTPIEPVLGESLAFPEPPAPAEPVEPAMAPRTSAPQSSADRSAHPPRRAAAKPGRAWAWPRMRLSARIVALSVLLLLLVQVAGFSVIGQSIELNAEEQLNERLRLATRVWDRMLDQRAARLVQSATVLAGDFGLREALVADDAAALRRLLEAHGQRTGASLAGFVDSHGHLRVTQASADPEWAPLLAQSAAELARRPAGSVVMLGQVPFQLVLVPVRAEQPVGWVVMAEALGEAVIEDMADVTGLHATLVSLSKEGRPRVLATSFKPSSAALPLAGHAGDGELELAGDLHLVNTASVTSGRSGRVTLRLAGSLAVAMAPYRPLQWILASITGLGLLLFGVGSHWMARRITEPLRRLASASERLAGGEYDQPLLTTGRGDEIDDLAAAFDHMRVSIAGQQREIRELAFRDRLTGLPNRLAFRDEVAAAIQQASRRKHPMAVVVADLDRFKQVNDVLGFAFGDRLLDAVAQRLRQVVRHEDEVARLGGNSFGLLLRHADARRAEALANRIAAALERPVQLDDQVIDLSAGVGIACWPQHARDVDALISRAEVAMYTAKRRTSGAQVYNPSIDTASAQNLSMLSALRRAIEHGELRLFLQPKVRLATGEARSAEALVRWEHPERGLVPPMDFIPFAEQTGFIRQLTLWMLVEVARLQGALARQGIERVSVNLSTRDLMDTELPTKLDAIMREHGARPDGFCLEITESAIMDDPQRAETTLNRLANRGFKLSIDDFGTGYSSLAYLKRLPVDELKIDKSFVMAMERNAEDAKIVRSTIDLAHNLGLQVVAEGVENQAILALLRALDCDEAQGYHLSKPVPVEDFVHWMGHWRGDQPVRPASPAQPVAAVSRAAATQPARALG